MNYIFKKIKTLKDIMSSNKLLMLKNILNGNQRIIDIYMLDRNAFLSPNKEYKFSSRLSGSGIFEVKMLSSQDLAYFDEYINLRKDIQLTKGFLEEALNNGCIIFLALLNTQIVGSVSAAFKEFPLQGDFNMKFMLGRNQAYIFHGFVPKEFRNNGVFSFLSHHVCKFILADNNIHQIIGAIYPWNVVSQKTQQNLGFVKYARIVKLSIFFIKRYRFLKWQKTEDKILLLSAHNGKTIRL